MSKNKKDVSEPWEKLGIRPVSIGQVPNILDVALGMNPKMTTCLIGETGVGKTPVVEQWAAMRGGTSKILNFGHMTQEEISMIMFNENGSAFDFVPPEWMLELNERAERDGLAVLFLDEWNRGDKSLVNALFTLCDDRRIHSFRLHDNVLTVAAMNPSDGSYLVNEAEKDHAIRKRLNFIYVSPDLRTWLEHTKKSAWHPLVPDFVKSAQQFFYDSGARDSGKCFPCPANWDKVSRILMSAESNGIPLTGSTVRAMVEGQVGSVASSKFMDFVADQNTVIQPKEILYNYNDKNGTARKKVASLLGYKISKKTNKLIKNPKATGSKHGTIHELNQAIAIELFSDMPPVDKIMNNLAQYVTDLPNDILSAFAAEHLMKEASSKEGGIEYLNRLSTEMQSHPGYQERIHLIFQAMKRYREHASLGTKGETDPAA